MDARSSRPSGVDSSNDAAAAGCRGSVRCRISCESRRALSLAAFIARPRARPRDRSLRDRTRRSPVDAQRPRLQGHSRPDTLRVVSHVALSLVWSTPTADYDDRFGRLIAPLTRDEFLNKHWGKAF